MHLYILKINEARLETFLAFVGSKDPFDHSFVEPVKYFESSDPHIVLISTKQDSITHIANGKKGRSAGTGLRQIILDDIEQISNPIDFRTIIDTVGSRVGRNVSEKLVRGGSLPDKSSLDVLSVIKI